MFSELRTKLTRSASRRFWRKHDREASVCVVCGVDEPLEVHHRDGNPLNQHAYNLVTVCHSCHVQEHRRRRTASRLESWKSIAQSDMGFIDSTEGSDA